LQFLIIIYCFSILLICFKCKKKIIDPLIQFNFIFLFVVTLYLFNFRDLYPVGQKTFTVIFVGLISYFIGYSVINQNNISKSISGQLRNKKILYELRYKVLYLIYIGVCALILIDTIQTINLLRQGYSMYLLRTDVLKLKSLPDWYGFCLVYIALPFVNILLPIGIIEFLQGKRKLIIPTFVTVILYAISNGGRMILIQMIFLLAIAIYYYKIKVYKKIKIKKSTIRLIGIAVTVMVVLVLVLSNMRGVKKPIYEVLHDYTVPSLQNLDVRLKLFENNPTYTYGFTYLRGFLNPLIMFLNSFHVMGGKPNIYYLSTSIVTDVETNVLVGSNFYMNAFVTPFYYFYVDGDLLGVLICSFIYGLISSIIYRNAMYKYNKMNFILYLLFMQMLSTTLVRWQFVNPSFALSFIYLPLLFKKVEISKSEEIES
jgi:oligosaccharide repeat unit polymerase